MNVPLLLLAKAQSLTAYVKLDFDRPSVVDEWARCPMAKIPDLHSGDPCSIHGGSIIKVF